MSSEPMSAYQSLHPALRHAIAHDLGWRALRPVQDHAIAAILACKNAVVLAPTAGGKTEASIFPALSRCLSEELAPVAVLYLCPIRALLNNQEERVQSYARMVGLDAFKWHGDVNASARKRFLRSPTHILLTTPESLEVMLVSATHDGRDLLRNVRMVIVDEVHAFANDDRGAHLVALLERLVHVTGADIQRVGLSATVGNPHVLVDWLGGSSKRDGVLVDPPKPPTQRELHVDYVEDVAALASRAAEIGLGRKSLVFVESRAGAERVAAAMQGRGVEVFVHHSAVSRADRAQAEERFAAGSNTAIVATSTLELGIDVGDLDVVMQADAPRSVASLLQRMGRTGRRPGTRPNLRMLCSSDEALLQGIALLRLAERGWVEDLQPPRDAMAVLAHQVLALTLQEGGVSRHRVAEHVGGASAFADLDGPQLRELLYTMIERDVLHESDGLLSLGLAGEARYGRNNFMELYSVFDAPQTLRVLHGRDEVGRIDALFVLGAEIEDGGFRFRLGNRAWRVTHVDEKRRLCYVRPAQDGKVPSWLGSPAMLAPTLCAEIFAVLASTETPPWLSPEAAVALVDLRAGYEAVIARGPVCLEQDSDVLRLHTFAGGRANELLALALEAHGGGRWTAGNLNLKAKDAGRLRAEDALRQLSTLSEAEWGELALEQTASLRVREGKFDPCLPERWRVRRVAGLWFDVGGARRVVAMVRR